MKTWGFDGIDIDWEFPVQGGSGAHDPADLTNFTLLLQKFRELLDAQGTTDSKHYLLSIASTANNNYYKNYEWTKIHPYLDFINVMTYDFHGTWETKTGFNAPVYIGSDDPVKTDYVANLAVDNSMKLLVAEGVPEGKMLLGIPFYGIGWGGVGSTNNGLYQTASGKSTTGSWENGHYDYSDLLANYEPSSSGFSKH
jgi:chitinase